METNDLCAWGSSAAPAPVNPRGARVHLRFQLSCYWVCGPPQLQKHPPKVSFKDHYSFTRRRITT